MELILSDSFEDVRFELKNRLEKMMDFVIPIEETENEIAIIAKSIRNCGKLLLMHGAPGVGKSTFLQSMLWRSHLPIRQIINIDATEFSRENSQLTQLIEKIKYIIDCNDISTNSNGVFTIVIDYLESIQEEAPQFKKSFFRDLNGLLRKAPLFIIWPMTEEQDIEDTINYTKAVSGTLFYLNKEVINFKGPRKENFPDILKNTISVLNTGYIYSDFSLTEPDFSEVLDKRVKAGLHFTIRDYIGDIRNLWSERTKRVDMILASIPKPTEVWFIFCMPEAEQVTSQFVRKSQNIDECWNAYHAKLDEYIHNNQKASYWNSNRLQLALSGVFKTKIMHLQTNALVSCLAAYGTEFKKIDWDRTGINSTWKNKSTAKSFLKSTPMVRQLKREATPFGASRGRVSKALEDSRVAFDEINKITAGFNVQRDGSDKPFNKIIASALGDILPGSTISSEKAHPWLSNIYPDITIELEDRLVCLEFHYTKKTAPFAVADYVLKKMDTYMRQIESKYPDLH